MENNFKLDIYNNSVCNSLYNCQKDEKYCKSMVSKLVFYDRDEILDRHSKSLTDKNYKYSVDDLPKKSFLGPKEKVLKVIPLESSWIAVLFADKKTGELIKDKVMYISSDGEGYFSSDLESALNGIVPDEMYCKFVEDNPNNVLQFEGDDTKILYFKEGPIKDVNMKNVVKVDSWMDVYREINKNFSNI